MHCAEIAEQESKLELEAKRKKQERKAAGDMVGRGMGIAWGLSVAKKKEMVQGWVRDAIEGGTMHFFLFLG